MLLDGAVGFLIGRTAQTREPLRTLPIVLAADAIGRTRDRSAPWDAAELLYRAEKFEVFLLELPPARWVEFLPQCVIGLIEAEIGSGQVRVRANYPGERHCRRGAVKSWRDGRIGMCLRD